VLVIAILVIAVLVIAVLAVALLVVALAVVALLGVTVLAVAVLVIALLGVAVLVIAVLVVACTVTRMQSAHAVACCNPANCEGLEVGQTTEEPVYCCTQAGGVHRWVDQLSNSCDCNSPYLS
jgi:hypothetical protein